MLKESRDNMDVLVFFEHFQILLTIEELLLEAVFVSDLDDKSAVVMLEFRVNGFKVLYFIFVVLKLQTLVFERLRFVL
jgi:hypothetical protein